MQIIFLVIVVVLAVHYWAVALGVLTVLLTGAVGFYVFVRSSGKGVLHPKNTPGEINIEIRIKDNGTVKSRSRRLTREVRSASIEDYSSGSKAKLLSRGSNEGTLIRAMAPTRGLVILERPLSQILSGEKTLELRSKHNRRLGSIALIKKGSGQVYGIAEIAESIGPMSREEFWQRRDEHGVEDDRINEVFDRGWIYGWRMRGVVRLSDPVPYIHKGMSQVNLDQQAIDDIQGQLDAA